MKRSLESRREVFESVYKLQTTDFAFCRTFE